WKEIAAYLGREVRTVQLWEKGEGLPVHRHQHARQGSVYAFKSELDAWRESRRALAAAAPENSPADQIQAPSFINDAKRARMIWIAGGIIAVLIVAFWFIFYGFQHSDRSAPAQGPTSVVVLPFIDLSPQKDQEYFSDGLTEEIIDALSRVPNLHVVSRTS